MNEYSDIQKKELKITMLVIEMLTTLKEQLSWIVWKWKSRRKEHPN